MSVTSPTLLKLSRGAKLRDEDHRLIARMMADTRDVASREDIISEGDNPEHVHIVLEGFAVRYKLLPDGGRQIMAWLIPGDFCDLHVTLLHRMDHSIAAVSPCRVAYVPQKLLDEVAIDAGGPLNRALWWANLVDEAVLREWLVGMGRRSAEKQIAHLFCELLYRLRLVGLAGGSRYDFPAGQEALADTVGLSAVHVNRVLQQLRADGLIRLEGKVLTVLDEVRLMRLADFDPTYLHLSQHD